jgi:hypothetical protein
MSDWLDLAESLHLAEGCPLHVTWEMLGARGHLTCDRCRAAVVPGELVFLAGRCSMGGEVGLGVQMRAYRDLLEPVAVHVRCTHPEVAHPACCTAALGGWSLEEVARRLHERSVRVVVDVEFGSSRAVVREVVRESLVRLGFCYLHVPELSGPRSPNAVSLESAAAAPGRRVSPDHRRSPTFEHALQELIDLLHRRPSALLGEAEDVAGAVDALLARGIPCAQLLAPRGGPHR